MKFITCIIIPNTMYIYVCLYIYIYIYVCVCLCEMSIKFFFEREKNIVFCIQQYSRNQCGVGGEGGGAKHHLCTFVNINRNSGKESNSTFVDGREHMTNVPEIVIERM